ncbi:MAG: winged helix-turn-helix transcriptional regulator [Leptolyngbya sp. UWPOB_LEPTO1]|uniref:ArsR/SmtB family transcription factor n=1 Tax=Leptolyngbya sp. UWPOB_LEPTO1 TaxID=2815653 RepID=UPI001AC15B83|nr:metalloregulator ArsR/SmtB family transcription factor [Leptolyngbya sp. UWPOB_LEPTO1]MBN8560121.1 winged helix-turn-helix transcriptional regulator [Leptolyngbya sp. UWPOB_LEPTO1]
MNTSPLPATVYEAESCSVPCFNPELVVRIRTRLPDDRKVRSVAALHNALADPTRLKIILALSQGELCVCDISHVIGLSVSATSHQLRVLRNLNVVDHRSDGRMAYYSLPKDTALLPCIEQALSQLI